MWLTWLLVSLYHVLFLFKMWWCRCMGNAMCYFSLSSLPPLSLFSFQKSTRKSKSTSLKCFLTFQASFVLSSPQGVLQRKHRYSASQNKHTYIFSSVLFTVITRGLWQRPLSSKHLWSSPFKVAPRALTLCALLFWALPELSTKGDCFVPKCSRHSSI